MSFWSRLNSWFTDRWNGAEGRSYKGSVHLVSEHGRVIWEDCDGASDYRKVFEKCSPLASIVSNKAAAFSNACIEVVNRNTQKYVRGQYKIWETLLMQPNFMQSRTQFFRQLYSYVAMQGWCYVLPIYPAGFDDVPSALWVLPPWLLDVEPANKAFYQIGRSESARRVYFCWNGQRTELKEKDLILFTDTTSTYDENTWLPNSRVKGLKYPVTNQIGSMESRATLIQRRGAIGILANTAADAIGVQPMLPNEKEALQKEFRRYGLARDQWQLIITDAALKWQPMAMPVKDLMLHEEHVSCMKDICDAYTYPFVLTSHSDQSTYNNLPIADRRLYQNAIIPEAQNLFEQLNNGLRAAEQNIEILATYDHVPALQSTEKERSEARKATNEFLQMEWDNGLITRNMWLDSLGRDKVDRDEFNKYKWEMTPEQQNQVTNEPETATAEAE